jgi:hypothetical protein
VTGGAGYCKLHVITGGAGARLQLGLQVIVRVQVVTGGAGYLKGQVITGGAGYCKDTGCDRGYRLS